MEVYGAPIKTPSERGIVGQDGERIKRTVKRVSNVRQIRLKPQNHRLPSTGKKYSVKRVPCTVKTSSVGTRGVKLKDSYMQSKQAARGMQAAKKVQKDQLGQQRPQPKEPE